MATIDNCINYRGFNYGRAGWHPFVEAIRLHKNGKSEDEVSSMLIDYWQKTYASNALDELQANLNGPDYLKNLKPDGVGYRIPFSKVNQDDVEKKVIKGRIKEEGLVKVNPRKGSLNKSYLRSIKHYIRCVSTYESIKSYGYNRQLANNDITGVLLERGNEYKVLIRYGQHRIAALSALGFTTAPVRLQWGIIRKEEVDNWLLVKAGLWDKHNACIYFDYLFDFNSSSWAKERGLFRCS